MSDDRPWLQHYAPGVPADATIPEVSVVDLLRTSAERLGANDALVFFGGATTYAQAWAQSLQAAEVLRGLGVGPGDRVAIVLPNCPQHVTAFYGALRLGAVVVEHNPLYTQEELARQFADHSPSVVIAWDVVAAAVRASVPEDVPVLAVDMSRALPLAKRALLRLPIRKARQTRAAMTTPATGLPSWDRMVAASAPVADDVPSPTPDDVALLQYTGGTTGIPKGAMLTHRNLVANAAQSAAWAAELKPGQEVFYAVLPLFHAYGLTLCFTTAVLLGATVVMFPRFDPDMVLDAMKDRPATFLPGVPPMYPRLAARARERGVSLASIRFALAGAMSLSPAIIDEWEAATGGLLVEGYGMTESSPIVLGNPISPARRPGTIGVPFPNTFMRVVDPADPTHELPPGEPGELLVRGPQVFGGYWNRPEDTEAALLPGGWLRTGDIVLVEDDGFVRIVDRIKELVLVGGFNVYPSEVEAVLVALPGVQEAVVVAMPSDEGERAVAAIVPEPGVVLDLADLRVQARQRLAGYKVPREFVLIDDVPKSTIGKVLRSQVRDQLLARA